MITAIFLKFLHYVSLFFGGWIGVANAMLFKNHKKAEMPQLHQFKNDDDAGEIGFSCHRAFWVTGIPLTYKYMVPLIWDGRFI